MGDTTIKVMTFTKARLPAMIVPNESLNQPTARLPMLAMMSPPFPASGVSRNRLLAIGRDDVISLGSVVTSCVTCAWMIGALAKPMPTSAVTKTISTVTAASQRGRPSLSSRCAGGSSR